MKFVTVGDLRKLIQELPDDTSVLVWDEYQANDIFQGFVEEGVLHLDIFDHTLEEIENED